MLYFAPWVLPCVACLAIMELHSPFYTLRSLQILHVYLLFICYLLTIMAVSTAGIASWTSSRCVRCVICHFLHKLLLNSNNELRLFATFLSWVEIWVEKLATQIFSILKSSWVAFWVSPNAFYVEPTQICVLSRLNFWVAFIQPALNRLSSTQSALSNQTEHRSR